jgi:hypothetical protein
MRERSTVFALTPLERARDADALHLHCVVGRHHHRVAVAAHTDEGHVRRELWIRCGACFGDVAALCVFETRCDAVRSSRFTGAPERPRWNRSDFFGTKFGK